MGEKGEKTKDTIIDHAMSLFAAKGFIQVTMKDICECTGLSRGGLYRHFSSTDEIFESMFKRMADDDNSQILKQMTQGISSIEIINNELNKLKKEMLNNYQSLSLAIYEYSVIRNRDFFINLNEKGREKWNKLIDYGVKRNEINVLEKESVIDIILYTYQGVRMWSRIIDIDEKHIDGMINQIKHLLGGEQYES